MVNMPMVWLWNSMSPRNWIGRVNFAVAHSLAVSGGTSSGVYSDTGAGADAASSTCFFLVLGLVLALVLALVLDIIKPLGFYDLHNASQRRAIGSGHGRSQLPRDRNPWDRNPRETPMKWAYLRSYAPTIGPWPG